jgi:hypothetical protein
MALHEQCVGATDEWYTPPHVFNALGCSFDMDVATSNPPVPWVPTSRFLWDRSLEQPWDGFIWMNPPFGARNGLVPWLEKFFAHGNGIALVPDRTSAPWWQQFTPRADLVLFATPKIKFIDIHGNQGNSPAQGTCLFALGDRGRAALLSAAAVGLGSLMAPVSRPDRTSA